MRLMDSDVCIDIQRGFAPAIAWFASVTEPVAVPGFVAMELVEGCENKADLRRIQKFLARFPVVWASEGDMNRALIDYAPLHLSHGSSRFDALIASTAIGMDAELLTFNTKHFKAVRRTQDCEALHEMMPPVVQ